MNIRCCHQCVILPWPLWNSLSLCLCEHLSGWSWICVLVTMSICLRRYGRLFWSRWPSDMLSMNTSPSHYNKCSGHYAQLFIAVMYICLGHYAYVVVTIKTCLCHWTDVFPLWTFVLVTTNICCSHCEGLSLPLAISVLTITRIFLIKMSMCLGHWTFVLAWASVLVDMRIRVFTLDACLGHSEQLFGSLWISALATSSILPSHFERLSRSLWGTVSVTMEICPGYCEHPSWSQWISSLVTADICFGQWKDHSWPLNISLGHYEHVSWPLWASVLAVALFPMSALLGHCEPLFRYYEHLVWSLWTSILAIMNIWFGR